MPRTDFTDTQKAQLFVRDKALCSYSGRSLWLIDYGADGVYMADWADHVTPASKGGVSSLDNGACVSWLYNYAKRDNSHPGIPLYSYGFPTRDYFSLHNEIPYSFLVRAARFSGLLISDWYFNRAVFQVGLGLSWLHDSNIGPPRQRDNLYYANSALKRIHTWRKLTSQNPPTTLEERRLVPKVLYNDHKLLLKLRQVDSAESILEIMNALLPTHSANLNAQEGFAALYEEFLGSGFKRRFVDSYLQSLAANQHVTRLVRRRILRNINILFGLHDDDQ